MKTQTKIIIPVVIIGSVLSFLVFKTDNTKNIEVTTSKNQVQIFENNISSKSENISENKTEEINQNSETNTENIETSTGEISEENSEPKEVSIVAEDILYPEEYDFSFFEDDTVMTAIGHPVKIDTTSFSTLKEGDTFEITFGGDTYKFLIDNIELEGDGKTRKSYIIKSRIKEFSMATLSMIYSQYFDENLTYLKIKISYNGGETKTLNLTNGLGYYYTNSEWQEEFDKQGYKID